MAKSTILEPPGPIEPVKLKEIVAEVCARRTFADHHGYRPADVAGLDPELLWVTTAKDAIKIPANWVEPGRLVVLEEQVDPGGGVPLADWIDARLFPLV
jgi:hypothetical protein